MPEGDPPWLLDGSNDEEKRRKSGVRGNRS